MRTDSGYASELYALRNALYLPNVVLVFGALGFLVSAWYVEEDRRRCEEEIAGECEHVKLFHRTSSFIAAEGQSLVHPSEHQSITAHDNPTLYVET